MILASLTSAFVAALAPMLLAAGDSTAPRLSGAPTTLAVAAPAPRRDSAATPAKTKTPPPTPAILGVVAVAPTIAHPASSSAPTTVNAPAAWLAMPVSVAANGRRFFGTADSLLVEKAAHRLTLFRDGMPVVSYAVALGRNPVGQKVRAGDYRTPEGLYHIDARNPGSRYHLGLHVSYPNVQDLARAHALGVSTGGDIMIHGLPNGQGSVGAAHREYDWTNGCVAVTDEEIEEIWSSVPVGTPVRIVP
jgi:lipoprotein-anchoring transpeptidase ErfK/SrfK